MEQLDYKELAARTHLDARRIKAVMERDFAALAGANVPMTLKVLERELGEDFTAWREEYAAWSAEHQKNNNTPKIAPTLQGYKSKNENSEKEGSSWFAWLLVFAALGGAAVYFSDEIRDFSSQVLERISSSELTETDKNVEKSAEKNETFSPPIFAVKSEASSAQDEKNSDDFAGEREQAFMQNAPQTQDAQALEASSAADAAAADSDRTDEREGAASEADREVANDAANDAAVLDTASASAADEVAPRQSEPAADRDASDAGDDSAATDDNAVAADSTADVADEPATKELALAKPAPLSILPHKVAWLSIKDLSSGKTRNFSITKAHKITAPSLIFVGTTAYEIELGSKVLAAPGRYFIYDGKGVRAISKTEYIKLNSRGLR